MRYFVLSLCIAFLSCNGPNSESMAHKFTNELINETSPYLLQHAHNPVNWKAWNSKTLKEAKDSRKLILISIGYAACHWCHVMEHESFEDSLVAQVMNEIFINIKVDREERPDVDQIYMGAVQLMSGHGGWPLNVVALPDGRPIWGGTYFKKEQWISALTQISRIYKENPEKLNEFADRLEQGIKSMSIVNLNTDTPVFHENVIDKSVENWSRHFDHHNGGLNRAPKFMMPNNYHFLLRLAFQSKDEKLMDFVNLTLTKMAYGGVYDHIGGGFSRYSVDSLWHVPHFEKMLYDNAQLVSLYSDAFLLTKDPLYKDVVIETLTFVEREMMTEFGAFYSSYDADSETENGALEEGAYYVWREEELKSALKNDFELFANYYNINTYGLWENNNYVLIRKENDQSILKKYGLNQDDLEKKKEDWKRALLEIRDKRPKPRLDDKSLTSWNALMLKAYVDAYRVFGNKPYLDIALKNAEFIMESQYRDDGGLFHNFKEGKSTINGYLEDYATTIEAFLGLYEQTLNDKWLLTARDLTHYVFDHFMDDSSKMFFFTSNEDDSLVARSIEYTDNVIPASNSIMAKNLFKLSHYFNNEHFSKTAMTMLNNIQPTFQEYGSGYSNWMDLMLNYTDSFYEVAIVGQDALMKLSELNSHYLPNKIIAVSFHEQTLPLLKNRYIENKTLIYVCVDNACKLPVSDVKDALPLLKN